MASPRIGLLPIIRNTYGMKTFVFTGSPPTLLSTPVIEYFVQVSDSTRLPTTRCFSLNYGEGTTFAILPVPSIVPELAPVFDYLNSNPPDRQLEQASRNGSVTTVFVLQGEMSSNLHARTVQVMSLHR